MITFFTVPKPSKGQMILIQDMSLCCWKALPCDKHILLFDKDVRTTAGGTPLLDDIFTQAAEKARYDTIIYSNADMLYTSDLIQAVRAASDKFPQFLMVGQRTDIPLVVLDFRHADWEKKLRLWTAFKGVLHPPHGIDYFVLKRDMVRPLEMPSFAVGRPAWDNWMIYRCLELGYPVIDATGRVLAAHQNHDFSHLPGGRRESRYGMEAMENRRLAGENLKTITDATYRLDEVI